MRSSSHRFEDVLEVVVHAEDEDARLRRSLDDLRDRVQSRPIGHGDVEHQNVRPQLRARRNGIGHAPAFSNDRITRRDVEDHANALTHDGVIVNHHDSNGPAHETSSRSAGTSTITRTPLVGAE